MDRLGRALDFMRWTYEYAATEVLPFRYGTAQFNTTLDTIWDLNHLRVDEAHDALTADALVDDSARLHGERSLKFGSIMVFDEALGAGVEPRFGELGWRSEVAVVMEHPRDDDVEPLEARAVEVTPDRARAFRERSRRNLEDWGDDDEVVKQMERWDELTAGFARPRSFGAEVDGDVVSMCELYSDGSTAQVENVATLEEFQNRGLARAVVRAAVRAAEDAGHDFVFLTANDRDWPKDLYARLGFEPLGRFYHFLKT